MLIQEYNKETPFGKENIAEGNPQDDPTPLPESSRGPSGHNRQRLHPIHGKRSLPSAHKATDDKISPYAHSDKSKAPPGYRSDVY